MRKNAYAWDESESSTNEKIESKTLTNGQRERERS